MLSATLGLAYGCPVAINHSMIDFFINCKYSNILIISANLDEDPQVKIKITMSHLEPKRKCEDLSMTLYKISSLRKRGISKYRDL